MPPLSLLNDNANRRYPFVNSGQMEMLFSGGGNVALPHDAIVEATFIVGVASGYDEEEDIIYLHEIRREGTRIYFHFRCTADRLNGYAIEFCRFIDDPEYASSNGTLREDDGEFSASFAGGSCDITLMQAWITTGSLRDLSEILADGQWLRRADGDIYLEPSRVVNLNKAFVNSINIANQDRTRVPDGTCDPVGESSSYFEGSEGAAGERGYFVNAICLTGPVLLTPGYNCVITQDDINNSIIIGAGVGLGAGEPCAEVPLYDGEEPPAGSNLLTGGPSCDEIIKAINGVSGPSIIFVPGRGFRIDADESNPHKLNITIDLHGLAVCSGEGEDA